MGTSVNLFPTEWDKGWNEAIQATRSILTSPSVQGDLQDLVSKHSRVVYLLHDETRECRTCNTFVSTPSEHVTEVITQYLLGLVV